jgi:hypothetical protein
MTTPHPDKPDGAGRPADAGQILSGQMPITRMPNTGRRVPKEKGAE